MGNDTQPYDNFGSSCALYETTLVIGAEKAHGQIVSCVIRIQVISQYF